MEWGKMLRLPTTTYFDAKYLVQENGVNFSLLPFSHDVWLSIHFSFVEIIKFFFVGIHWKMREINKQSLSMSIQFDRTRPCSNERLLAAVHTHAHSSVCIWERERIVCLATYIVHCRAYVSYFAYNFSFHRFSSRVPDVPTRFASF